ncbi:MAG: bifunctional (p)ppGpp synthetase/guanosine-3',5'-bis(diphosphate) 3'-pyrophosphohydrolase, partial [Oscillospiraceae bacterium]|nr:bifunctional (p)ppGpp synthetase/guanosine-3',5'-bis(diphosphate) 3'-pyrophosphohydrolase [Oscillospiraceae bacterium]
GDYIHSLKVDMFDDEVFVFTPRGKVISLPAGSTPIDFAYAIHSAVGNSMVGAKVNGQIAGYDQPLKNGDIVEILTSKSAKGPSRDWLNICKSNQARVKIKQWFKKERREENIARGKLSFEAELRRTGFDPAVLQHKELRDALLEKLSFDDLDDLYAAIGYGGLTSNKAVGRIKDELTRHAKEPTEQDAEAIPFKLPESGKSAAVFANSGVIVEDIPSCMVKFARCCTPVPGDDIVGFVTKGYGVSVHRRDCPNAVGASDPAQAGRWVHVAWAPSGSENFATSLEIASNDRDGLFLDIATIMTSLKVRVSEMSSRSLPEGKAVTLMTFHVRSRDELDAVLARIRAVPGVTDIKRGRA